jgi:RNA polymerase sigma factor (TIGR02999 family)
VSLTISSLISAAERGVGAFPDSLFNAPESGEGVAADALFSALYSELHALARRELARRMAPVNLSVTTLLHEAYLDMSARACPLFPDRARFMGYAARVMRGLIIDHARSRSAVKRGGEFKITSLDIDSVENPVCAKELSAISDALDELANVEPDLAEVVDLKFFCGCSLMEIAALQNLSERTVQRKWEKARIYLRRSIRQDLAA